MNRDKWKNHGGERRQREEWEREEWEKRDDGGKKKRMEAKTLKEGFLDETQEERKEKRGKGPGSQAEEKEGRRTMIGRIQEVLTNQQLDEEIGRAEEWEEWRMQQW